MVEDRTAEPAARLVAAKCQIDAERVSIGQPVVHPLAFADYALPLLNSFSRSAPDLMMYVPSHLIIGATWNPRWDPLPSGEEAVRLCDVLDSRVQSRTESWPLLFRVGSLPLWCATEGKNRVALYRAVGRPLPAQVGVVIHPDISGLSVRRGRRVSAVFESGRPMALRPLFEVAAAELLLAAGASEGAFLAGEEEARLERWRTRRSRMLDLGW